ncbi:MAG: acetyl-CoA C-acyltransferase [Gammaproteobacteria bacterium]|jgi:acetyl-CoA C-acetyltransferase|nr:acetyl-CoA C-acyltransferase [Gammaproteobacteria bacterium]MDH3848392.1 acetyl-CoA C-acyltransferase [Gammaproteobacteria bacterium]MDH3862599.1 acetyl-CoA C-acyltransferase [Gammaproteobacteria bacterium]MDH3904199.1 acetyl-CoA C-acyltransferase [Gammaproteobacteria bacterium]NCF58942.1 acetyl-CoA C-acyltransferase [Gammaproteobacteria bacterium]
MSTDPVVIVAARRTPIGAFQGAFSDVSATELGAAAVAAAVADSGVDPADVGRVLMGCVLPAGLGQAPARQAALGAGLPKGVPCATVNKMCGSGMEALVLGHDLVASGSAAIAVAGGLESMTNAPYLMPKARKGYRMGHQEILDHMFYDGLQDIYEGHMMGHYAEATSQEYGFTREDQDAFAIESVTRATRAAADGSFDAEITPVTVKTRKGEHTVSVDEVPGTVSIERIPKLRPAFAKDGTVTAASSSSISDGAAALVIMRASDAEKRGLEPLARIVGHSAFAHEPAWFTTAPVHALKSLQESLGWTPDDVDIYEINEAFACVTMAAMKDVDIDAAKVNVNGGACALGHPIGATGARITTTLLHAMRARNLKRGIATQCIGGGEATAVALEID